MQKKITQEFFYMIFAFVVIVGSLNWLSIGLINTNLVDKLSTYLSIPMLSRIIYIIVGIAALFLMFNRNFYLPFLGKSVVPCSFLIPDKVPDNADISVQVTVKPNSKVIYWASETDANKELVKDDPWSAYTKFENAGVVTSDSTGKAILKVRNPTKYKVPGLVMNKTLDKHIHYRVCGDNYSMLSQVETTYIN
jgi:uncharacterized membrane protein YuzA (DUF378 family)